MSAPIVIEPVKPAPTTVGRVEPLRGSAIVGMLRELDDSPPDGSGESGLPQSHHDAYRLKLQGISPDDIGKRFCVSRVTVWRWCKAVEAEYRESIETEPVLNQIASEIARLDDLEQQNRDAAAKARAGRERALFLSEARKCAGQRANLKLSVGILPRAPEKLFAAVADLRPADLANPNDNPSTRSRDDIIAELIGRLENSRTIS